MLCRIHCETIWSWAFICWKIFNHSFNFITCESSVYNSISSWLSLGWLYLFKNLPISFMLSILFVHSCCSILCISAVSAVTSFLISNFTDLSPLTFFLDESQWRLSVLSIFSKILAFYFIDLCYFFLCFYFSNFCSDLYDFFLLTVGFVCSFSSSFKYKFRLFEIFFLFL